MLSARVDACLPRGGLVLVASLLIAGCGSGGSASTPASDIITPPARAAGDPRGVSGTANNVGGAGLVLQINGGNDISIPSGAQNFSFSTLPEGSEYRVTIKSQPSGQACTLLRGAGIVGGADITDVSISCINNVTDPLVGTYVVVSDDIRDFVTFNADGTFVAATHEDDPSCGSSNGNGVEYGVYNWDANTGEFSIVEVVLDTNGVCGLFDVNEPETFGLLRAADGSLNLIDLQDTGGAERFTLKPVASATDTLIGSFGNAGFPDFAVLSSDGTYFVATTQADPVSGTTVGIEDGCYTTGSSLGAPVGSLQTDSESCPLLLASIDSNGTAGFSNASTTQYTVVDPNTVTFGGGADATTLTRILPNTFGARDRNNVLAGTYFSDLGITGKRTYITFYDDGTFLLGSHEDEQSCGPSLGNGVEYGVYQWDRTSGAFQVVNGAIDTNGSCGLINQAQGAQGTLLKSPSGFTFSDGSGEKVFSVVLPSLGNPLLGSAKLPSPDTHLLSGPDFVVFTSDGRYFQASVSADESSQPAFVAGIEDGCYSDDGGTLAVDLGGGCSGAIDTNGSAGLALTQGSSIPYQISGADTLTLSLGQLELADLKLTRMFPNSPDSLSGTYAIGGKRAFITFYDDGAFAIGAHNFDPRQSEEIPDDVEFGVYDWNRATGSFMVLAGTLDTNNNSAILGENPQLLTESGDGMLLLIGSAQQDVLTPVESIPGTLIGRFFYAGHSPRSVVVFSGDGSYFLMDLAAELQTGNFGIEDGCYAAVPDSSATGSFIASRSRCLSVADGLGTLDTNVTQGFPEDFPASYLRLDPNTLELHFDFDTGGGVIIGI